MKLQSIPDQHTHEMLGWQSKGIKPETLKTYGVQWVTKVNQSGVPILEHDEDGTPYPLDTGSIRFPYYDISSGRLVGFKYRDLDKEEAQPTKKFVKAVNGDAFTVFGLQTGGNKTLILTEGESDTLAWKQAVGEATVWGIPGTQWVDKSLVAVMERLVTSFDRIYIALDSDSAGRDALEVACGMLPPLKTYIVNYPSGCKDACDVLKRDSERGLKSLLKTSTQLKPVDVMDSGNLMDKALELADDAGVMFGVTTGWEPLDELAGGWTPGKIMMLAGDTGTGKTTMVLNMTYNAIKEGLNVFFIPLEMTPEQVLLKLVEIHLRRAIISDPKAVRPSREEMREAMVFITDRVQFLNKFGSLSKDYLVQKIEVMVRAYKTNLVVLDHVTAATQAQSGGGWKDIDELMYALKASALEHRITMLVVSHINSMNNAKRPTADMLRGSRGLKQVVDLVLLIHRDFKTGLTELWTGKVDRFIGKHGCLYFKYIDYRFELTEAPGEDDEMDEEIGYERKPASVTTTVQANDETKPEETKTEATKTETRPDETKTETKPDSDRRDSSQKRVREKRVPRERRTHL